MPKRAEQAKTKPKLTSSNLMTMLALPLVLVYFFEKAIKTMMVRAVVEITIAVAMKKAIRRVNQDGLYVLVDPLTPQNLSSRKLSESCDVNLESMHRKIAKGMLKSKAMMLTNLLHPLERHPKLNSLAIQQLSFIINQLIFIIALHSHPSSCPPEIPQKKALVYNIWKLQLPMSKKDNNILLQKSQLGKVKPGFHQLPKQDHVYGKAPQKDEFGARDVVSGWQQHTTSSVKEPGKNFVAMNKEGIKQGCVDSKQISNFHKDNEIKIKVKEGQKYYGVSIPNEDFTYGVPNRPSTPIKNVICNTYAEEELQLKKERDAVVNMLQKSNKKSPPKVEAPLKASKQGNKKKEVEDHEFKLAKFKNVESKVKPMMNNPNAKP